MDLDNRSHHRTLCSERLVQMAAHLGLVVVDGCADRLDQAEEVLVVAALLGLPLVVVVAFSVFRSLGDLVGGSMVRVADFVAAVKDFVAAVKDFVSLVDLGALAGFVDLDLCWDYRVDLVASEEGAQYWALVDRIHRPSHQL